MHPSAIQLFSSVSNNYGGIYPGRTSHDDAKSQLEGLRRISTQKAPLFESKWRILHSSCIQNNHADLVVEITESMLDLEFAFKLDEWISLLSVICSNGRYNQGLRIFERAVTSGCDLTVHVFSPLLKTCGSAKEARRLFQRMEFFGFSPNVISFTSAIKSCEGNGDWRSALELLDLMRAVGVEPNEITYCCIISVASKGLAGNIALNILQEMSMNNVPPNYLCYSSALSACARCGMWKDVDMLLYQMERQGVPLTESILIALTVACRNSSTDAPSPSQWQPRVGTEKDYWTFNQGGSSINPALVNWRKALALVKQWAPKVKNITESVFTMVMDVFASARRYDEIISLYWLMPTLGAAAGKNACR